MKQMNKDNQINEPILHQNGLYYTIMPINVNNENVIPVKIFHTINPARLPEEHYFEYRIRKRITDKKIKEYLKGTLIWDTSKLGNLTMKKAQEIYAEYIKTNQHNQHNQHNQSDN